jgi:hypothetical protein
MIAVLIILAVGVVAVAVSMYSRRDQQVFDDAMRRTVVDLHAIRGRDNLREYKREVRRNAEQVRRELDQELGSK